jgi:prevent-host-death family protein
MGARRVERIGIRELRQNASTYIDLVWREGVIVEVTNRGRLAARIVPAEEPDDPLAQLEAEGLVVRRAARRGGLLDVERLPPLTEGPTLTETLLQMREEERY